MSTFKLVSWWLDDFEDAGMRAFFINDLFDADSHGGCTHDCARADVWIERVDVAAGATA